MGAEDIVNMYTRKIPHAFVSHQIHVLASILLTAELACLAIRLDK